MKDLGNKQAMAQNLKRLMKEKNINAKDFSRITGYAYTTILSWLKADNYPRIERIEEMAKYFGVLKSDLIEEHISEEMKKDHDTITDAVVRMRKDAEFYSVVDRLLKDAEFSDIVNRLVKMDPSELGGVQQMLDALQAFSN